MSSQGNPHLLIPNWTVPFYPSIRQVRNFLRGTPNQILKGYFHHFPNKFKRPLGTNSSYLFKGGICKGDLLAGSVKPH